MLAKYNNINWCEEPHISLYNQLPDQVMDAIEYQETIALPILSGRDIDRYIGSWTLHG